MSAIRRFTDFRADRLRLTRDDFLKKHPSAVLLHRLDLNADEGELASATGHISMIDLPGKAFEIARSGDPLAALGLLGKGSSAIDVVVFPIVKRLGAVFHDRVSVGRNRNADIHLPFRRISKFHAFFTSAPATSKYLITDAGSTNGTFISGKRVPTGQPVEIAERSIIHFSHFLFVFVTAPGFYSLLSGD
jgi:hypothetical protein